MTNQCRFLNLLLLFYIKLNENKNEENIYYLNIYKGVLF